jgi:arsenate reductase (glutaredoxin)
MSKVTIYHNARCSKSRQALQILNELGLEVEIIEYIKNPPSFSELSRVAKLLKVRPKELVRTKEEEFSRLKPDLDNDTATLELLHDHPQLMERPIVVYNNHAEIGRPPERIRRLFL